MINDQKALIRPFYFRAGRTRAAVQTLFAATLCIALLSGGCSSGDEPSEQDTSATAAKETEHTEAEKNRVTLTEAAYQTAEILVEPVRSSSASSVSEDLSVPGQVEYDPRRVALISPRVAGRLERLTAVEGDRVSAGETVALLYSAAYVTAQNDLRQAARRAEVLRGTADESGALALLDAARRRVRLLGVGDHEIQRVAGGGEPRDYLAITAPFSGSIVDAHAMAGAALEAGQEIFKVADVSVVDVVAEVPERSMPLVSVGQRALIAIAAYPSLKVEGRVERLRGELNAETRTVRAVIHANNPTGRLRPGMFATVQLSVPARAALGATGSAATSAAVLTIPESAVVSEGERRFVFIEVGERTFERREVTVSSLAPTGSTTPVASHVIVREGLSGGERVVVRGAFTLKSELAKAGLSEHGH
jgi:multidrug efflux pump subunit AcrA (membrane-fusion protein)